MSLVCELCRKTFGEDRKKFANPDEFLCAYDYCSEDSADICIGCHYVMAAHECNKCKRGDLQYLVFCTEHLDEVYPECYYCNQNVIRSCWGLGQTFNPCGTDEFPKFFHENCGTKYVQQMPYHGAMQKIITRYLN